MLYLCAKSSSVRNFSLNDDSRIFLFLRGVEAEQGMMTATTVLFDSARLRITDVRLPPGASLDHRHEYPTLRWQVEEGIERSVLRPAQVNGVGT